MEVVEVDEDDGGGGGEGRHADEADGLVVGAGEEGGLEAGLVVADEVDVGALVEDEGVVVLEGVGRQRVRHRGGDVPPVEGALHEAQRTVVEGHVTSCIAGGLS